MNEKTLYIPPESEAYTGYTNYIIAGTNISNVSSFYQVEKDKVIEYKISEREEVEKEYIFPESREELFLDKDLLEFYRKKGYDRGGIR